VVRESEDDVATFRSLFGFRSTRGAPAKAPAPEPPPPTPAERAQDHQARLDEEDRAMVESAHAAFTAQLLADGYVFPADPSPSLEAHRERLRLGRGARRW
jgi:hypothetical protein